MKLSSIRTAKNVRTALVAAIIAVVAFDLASFASFNHCHGSSHDARGAYCETVYSNEEGYRALQ